MSGALLCNLLNAEIKQQAETAVMIVVSDVMMLSWWGVQQVEDLEQLVGQQMDLKFLEVDEEEERCVFSARNASRQDVHGFEVRHILIQDCSALRAQE